MDSDHYTEREVKWTPKPLREVWLNIGLEKVNIHSGVLVKALLDSRAMGLFMSKRLAEKQGVRVQSLVSNLRLDSTLSQN